jgi:hypothetical protein
MPERYHIHTATVPGRFHRIGKYGSIDWREDCSRCSNCVKLRCNYDVYKHESTHNRDPFAEIRTLYECKACFSCVQGCTKGLLGVSLNPGFYEMGDQYWTADIITTTWNQAETGKIPVSGAGYRGVFHGAGFDSIWTDMSEIVRPTRDGIHGREYISTSVDIGPKPMRLNFSPDGRMLTKPARLIELQLPAILDIPFAAVDQPSLVRARAIAAKELKTIAAVNYKDAMELAPELRSNVMPVIGEEIGSGFNVKNIGAIVQLIDNPGVVDSIKKLKSKKPQTIISVRMPLTAESANRISELHRQGIRVFQLCADLHGCEKLADGRPGRHIKDVLREIHGHLVSEGLRDETTLIISGGIALAEHMAKSIICGADLVAIDAALLVSLGCSMCGLCEIEKSFAGCPAGIAEVESSYAGQRIINLMGAWHSQLIEVLGAMGIREVRRLRGEMGRAIFREDIEKESFGDLLKVPGERVSA